MPTTESFDIDVVRGYNADTDLPSTGDPTKLYLIESSINAETDPPDFSSAVFYYYPSSVASASLAVGPRPHPKRP